MRILLLADDSITVQRVIALTFAREPVQVVAVSDGRQALESINAQKPDIILAGTSLPHVDGYDLAKQVRERQELQQMPILLLTGAFEIVDEARLKSSGANGVIEKPVEPTVVIRRVKELLGFKSEAPAAPAAGRLVTPAPPAPSNWEELRDQSGLEANAPSVQSSTARSGDHRDALDVAFDSLDNQLSGNAPAPKAAAPATQAPAGSTGDPVFEVDEQWFATPDEARTAGREFAEDLKAPELQMPAKGTGSQIFEVDETWFTEADQARAEKGAETQALAKAMGISDFTLPEFAEPHEPAPEPVTVAEPVAATVSAQPEVSVEFAAPIDEVVPVPEPSSSRDVADDFAALLAFEQGGPPPAFTMPPEPAQAPPAEPTAQVTQVEPAATAAPVITDDMLDSIAERVAARLNSSLGEQWREVMAGTVRDTVRTVVSETSERLVREEIDRIKNKQA